MKRGLLVVVALAACKEHRRPPADAAVFHGAISPPFRIELPGALPSAVVAMPDGGAIVALTITRAIAIAGTTFEPLRGPDALIVSISGDGQPRAAVSFGLDGAGFAQIADLALAPDGTVRAGLITDVGLPNARGTPTAGPDTGSQLYTLATIDLTRGVSDEITIGPVAPGGTTALVLTADGGAIVTRTASRAHSPTPASVVTLLSAAGEPTTSAAPTAPPAPDCGLPPWQPDTVAVLATSACRTIVKILAGSRAPGVYAAGPSALEPLGNLPANEPTPAAILADGGALVVGACDTSRRAGCLVRTNPAWR